MSCRAIYPRTFTQENVLLIDETITSDRDKNKFNAKKNYTLMTIRYALQKTTILFFSRLILLQDSIQPLVFTLTHNSGEVKSCEFIWYHYFCLLSHHIVKVEWIGTIWKMWNRQKGDQTKSNHKMFKWRDADGSSVGISTCFVLKPHFLLPKSHHSIFLRIEKVK